MKFEGKLINGARKSILALLAKCGEKGCTFRELADLGVCTRSNVTNSPIRAMLREGFVKKKREYTHGLVWSWVYYLDTFGAKAFIHVYNTTDKKFYLPNLGTFQPITAESYEYAKTVYEAGEKDLSENADK